VIGDAMKCPECGSKNIYVETDIEYNPHERIFRWFVCEDCKHEWGKYEVPQKQTEEDDDSG